MRRILLFLQPIVLALLVAFAGVSPNRAQEAPRTSAARTSEQAYKNIQVLKGLPANQLMPAMHEMSSALGQECGFCHVEDLSRDDKPAKQVARRMIAMTQALNKDAFGGRTRVGCDTCHRGATLPIAVPPVDGPERTGDYTWQGERGTPLAPLPSADEILAKYEEALGGREALRKVQTRVHVMQRSVYVGAVGVGVMPSEPSGITDVIRYAKMPDKIIANHSAKDGRFLLWMQGCDGRSCWTGENAGQRIPVGTDRPIVDSTYERQARTFYTNYFYGYMPLDLERMKQSVSRIEVRNRQKILLKVGPQKNVERDTYLLATYGKGEDGEPEYLYFDVESGLLLRRSAGNPTIFGPNYQQIDFSDYRDVGGTKVPFRHFNQHYDEKSDQSVSLVQNNVPIDDAVFAKPKTMRQFAR